MTRGEDGNRHPITQGSGVNLSNFALASGRRRQTVILGDADDSGEALLAELPAHDSVDRGSPLKIGGRAKSDVFPSVGELDRVDAWFTPNGQLGVVSTREANVVYDAGRRPLAIVSTAATLNNAAQLVVAAAPSLKTKVIFFSISPRAFTSVSDVLLRNGAAGPTLLGTHMSALGDADSTFSLSGLVLAETSVNTLLEIYISGNASVSFTVVYYQAP